MSSVSTNFKRSTAEFVSFMSTNFLLVVYLNYVNSRFLRSKTLPTFVLILTLGTLYTIYHGLAIYSGQLLTGKLVPSDGYLIYTSKCAIPKIDPFNAEVKHLYRKRPYVPCRKLDLLTYVSKSSDRESATVKINESLVNVYSSNGISCCYSNVTRPQSGDTDNTIVISGCIKFLKSVHIYDLPVIIRCSNAKTKREVYSNVHIAVTVKSKVRKKIKPAGSKQQKKASVLIISFDSISQLNFERTMPMTRNYLTEGGWLQYNGVNKVGLNTFPMLMAMLTGRNTTSAKNDCDPTVQGALDQCNFILYDFERMGYVTAYGEDSGNVSSFNYMKKGFLKEPVDYYFRPYALACEKLRLKRVDEMVYCTGPETYAERFFNVAVDFTKTFRKAPYFGLFWFNSFSHSQLNAPSRMDAKSLRFLRALEANGVLDNTVVLFLSDHGIRFGDILSTSTGWYEERLPFMFVWVPHSFRRRHPELYENLQINSHRLTSHYDIHMTLQHLLSLSDSGYTIKQSEACPKCRSLFTEIDLERSCGDASITPDWCTCRLFEDVNVGNTTLQDAGQYIVDQINRQIASHAEGGYCQKYKLSKIISSRLSRKTSQNDQENYLLMAIKTTPKASFEAILRTSESAAPFNLEGAISRIDMYEGHSECVKDYTLRTFCYCQDNFVPVLA